MTTTPSDPYQPYAAFSAGPAGGAQPPPPAAQPSSVAVAVKLMWAGAALSVLSLIYSLTTMGGLKDDLRVDLMASDPAVTQATVDVVYGVAITFAFLFGLVGALLWGWMAWKNGQGRSWARVVAMVFGGLNVLGLLYTAGAGSTDALTTVSSVASALLGVVILVLLWRKESTQFFEASAASRRLY